MEIWKEIPGFKGSYEVSTYGRVRSLDRLVKHWRGGKKLSKGKILSTKIADTGYPNVSLSIKGVIYQRSVHSIMAITFLSHTKDSGLVVDHIDKDPSNNHIENLRLITNRQNVTRHIESPGVTQNKRTGNWVARAYFNGVREYLGTYPTKEEANEAYKNRVERDI